MTKSRGIRVRRGSRQRWVEEQQGRHLCECGCGKPVRLRPEHFNTGIPRYLHGHNARGVQRAEPKPQTPCECGCGELAKPGKRYLAGHSQRGRRLSEEAKERIRVANTGPRNARYGERAHNWKGGRVTTPKGHVEIYVRGRGYIPEHRLIMETHLRVIDPESEFLRADGTLDPFADVHHHNEIKDDNRLENLVVLWKPDHALLHHARRRDRQRAALIATLDDERRLTGDVALRAGVPRTTARVHLYALEAEGLARHYRNGVGRRFPTYWTRA